jgi:shikimate kinase
MVESPKAAQSSGRASIAKSTQPGEPVLLIEAPTGQQAASPALALPQRIVLTGFMGAGKTTVGRLLAKRLGWRFLDVDMEIETATGATIAQLFQERGEPWFRQLEHETIRGLLTADSVVLALGGGAIEDARTRKLLVSSDETRLIHLEVTLETVLLRCQGTESIRPVLQDQANLERRYRHRLPLYRESHLTLAADSLPPTAIIDAILDSIRT